MMMLTVMYPHSNMEAVATDIDTKFDSGHAYCGNVTSCIRIGC